MKTIKNIGLIVCLVGFTMFVGSIFMGSYKVTEQHLSEWTQSKSIASEYLVNQLQKEVVGKTLSAFQLSSTVVRLAKASDEYHKSNINKWQQEGVAEEKINAEWSKVIWVKWDKIHKDFVYPLMQKSAQGAVMQHPWLFLLLTFGLAVVGGLMYILPDMILLGPPGIKNNGLFQHAATNRGWIGMIAFVFFVTFYIILYFFPDYLINPIAIVNPVSLSLSGNEASQWFLYGFMYCVVMTVFAVKMLVKYRHNKYQVIRTLVVLFFQVAFAFLIPEILVRFNQPWFDFKNAWPLNYTFFFDWNINHLMQSGGLGLFMLVWGIVLTLVIVPAMVYFFGKRWYCSWVCGCGGLAETLGDPYRHLSDKSLLSWKIERYLIHGVLLFAIVMTGVTLYTYFSGVSLVFGVQTSTIQSWYGFWIGSIFSGVIGTGFYPILGNRVWCRFGCPLAAYMGIVQRFKSRFRITTNGGQCISCGNCSTYCEQGIDVRAYAQKGQNIVRASCVGCGVCSAVCPRGVLKLENGPEQERIKENPILIGQEGVELNV